MAVNADTLSLVGVALRPTVLARGQGMEDNASTASH